MSINITLDNKNYEFSHQQIINDLKSEFNHKGCFDLAWLGEPITGGLQERFSIYSIYPEYIDELLNNQELFEELACHVENHLKNLNFDKDIIIYDFGYASPNQYFSNSENLIDELLDIIEEKGEKIISSINNNDIDDTLSSFIYIEGPKRESTFTKFEKKHIRSR